MVFLRVYHINKSVELGLRGVYQFLKTKILLINKLIMYNENAEQQIDQ